MCREFVGLDITEVVPAADLARASPAAEKLPTATAPSLPRDPYRRQSWAPSMQTVSSCAADAVSVHKHAPPNEKGLLPLLQAPCAPKAAMPLLVCGASRRRSVDGLPTEGPKTGTNTNDSISTQNTGENNLKCASKWMDSLAFPPTPAADRRRSSSKTTASRRSSEVLLSARNASAASGLADRRGGADTAEEPVREKEASPLSQLQTTQQVHAAVASENTAMVFSDVTSAKRAKKIFPSPLSTSRVDTSAEAPTKKPRREMDLFLSTLDI